METVPSGSVHGRFQPVHNGHLEYMLAAKRRCDFLWVGLTQMDVRSLEGCPEEPHRERPENNPLTYSEREALVGEVLIEAGVPKASFAVVPFSIDRPELMTSQLPIDVRVFTTIYDDWNRLKIRRLEEYGYVVEVLWERKIKEVDGKRVRSMIANKDYRWKKLVPPATAILVERLHISDRLQPRLDGTNGQSLAL